VGKDPDRDRRIGAQGSQRWSPRIRPTISTSWLAASNRASTCALPRQLFERSWQTTLIFIARRRAPPGGPSGGRLSEIAEHCRRPVRPAGGIGLPGRPPNPIRCQLGVLLARGPDGVGKLPRAGGPADMGCLRCRARLIEAGGDDRLPLAQ